MLTLYLSGGMRTDWQDVVIQSLGPTGFRYIDPRDNQTKDPKIYTPWDLFGVRLSDIVLAYLEEDNPSGSGLALEVGYARGLGKHVVCVIEPEDRKYWDIVKEASDISFRTLREAIVYIDTLRYKHYPRIPMKKEKHNE